MERQHSLRAFLRAATMYERHGEYPEWINGLTMVDISQYFRDYVSTRLTMDEEGWIDYGFSSTGPRDFIIKFQPDYAEKAGEMLNTLFYDKCQRMLRVLFGSGIYFVWRKYDNSVSLELL